MRIEKIKFKNYRQLREVELIFQKNNNDLHIFLGENGTGKTNILNGITWCLYNQEYHLSKESKQFPLLNRNVISESPLNSVHTVSVEIQVRTIDERLMTFKREQRFKIKNRTNVIPSSNKEFNLYITNPETGDTDIIDSDNITYYVERTFPNKIREFFFFDGERLDTYFKRATAANIQSAIKDISRINDLHSLSRRLKELKNENTKTIADNVPQIKEISNELREYENRLDDLKLEKETCLKEIERAKDELKKLENKLKGIPDIEKYETRFELLKLNKKRKEKIKKEYEYELHKLVFEIKKKIYFWPLIPLIMNVIKEKREKKQLPPPIDKDILERIIKNKHCELSDDILPEQCKGNIENLIKQHEISHYTSTQLVQIEPSLKSFKSILLEKYNDLKRYNGMIHEVNHDLDIIESDIKEIQNILRNHDNEKIKEMQNQRDRYVSAKDFNMKQLGAKSKQIEQTEETIKSLKFQLNSEIHNKKIRTKITKKVSFLTKSLLIIETVIDKVTNEIKDGIEKQTTNLFLNLVWKKDTFKNIKINDDFSIELYSVDGFSCLDSVGAAERKLLALSFTLALHEISGFDCPIIIDTPVSNVSGENRRNMGKILSKISKEKQIIILFTPDEYTENINSILDESTKNKHRLFLINMENEVDKEEFQIWE